MKLEAWGESDIGLVRKANQDAVGCFPELALFVIADGMGGRADGAIASKIAVETLRESVAGNHGGDATAARDRPGFWRSLLGGEQPASGTRPSPVDLVGAVALANRRVFAAGQQQASTESAVRGSMGTTVVALHCDLAAGRASWAHVGDSRLYRARDGEVVLLTADHTEFGAEFWDAATVPTDLPHTNRLMRALGIAPEVDVSERTAELRARDLYLLCSDGVSAMIAPDALRQALLDNGAVETIARRLIADALAGGGRDNASAVLVHVTED